MSDVVEDEEENGSSPLVVAAFLLSRWRPVPPLGGGGWPGHDNVQQEPWLQWRRRP
jgi:hypothetical protein